MKSNNLIPAFYLGKVVWFDKRNRPVEHFSVKWYGLGIFLYHLRIFHLDKESSLHMDLTTRNSLHDWRLHAIMTPGLFVDLAFQFVNVIHENHQIQGTIGNLHPSQIYISSNGSLLSWSGYVSERQLPYM